MTSNRSPEPSWIWNPEVNTSKPMSQRKWGVCLITSVPATCSGQSNKLCILADCKSSAGRFPGDHRDRIIHWSSWQGLNMFQYRNALSIAKHVVSDILLMIISIRIPHQYPCHVWLWNQVFLGYSPHLFTHFCLLITPRFHVYIYMFIYIYLKISYLEWIQSLLFQVIHHPFIGEIPLSLLSESSILS